MNKVVKKWIGPHRAAAYCRVSSSDQVTPEGSLKSQESRIRAYVDARNQITPFGEVIQVYVDPGWSGKDANRPELQRMLKAMERGEISMVIVSELSRISWNIRDFLAIWEKMTQYGISLVSLRENFDTSNAAGELLLYLLASLAEFERKQIGERIAANFASRASRGLYNGGNRPIGLKRIPEKHGYLAIDEEQAQVVRRAFKTFLRAGSLSLAARRLNRAGVRLETKNAKCWEIQARLFHHF